MTCLFMLRTYIFSKTISSFNKIRNQTLLTASIAKCDPHRTTVCENRFQYQHHTVEERKE